MSDPKEPVFRMDPSTFRVQEPPRAEHADVPGEADTASEAPEGDPTQPEAPVAPRPRKPRRPLRWADLIVSIVLFLLLAAAAVTASIFGAFLTFASDACSATGCNFNVMTIGIWVAVLSPWVVFLVALAGSIVMIVLRRISLWIPITAFVLIVALWLIGAVLVWAGT
ncbi:MAG: DUF6264 family protein [Microbacterium sp.]|uniref:DUF6264 family protein n=1 Tax=Microbacterium sp. TaxID=51671 RepID=UPI003241C710